MAEDTKTLEIKIQYNTLMPDEFVAEQARQAALQFLKRQKEDKAYGSFIEARSK